MPRTWFLSQSGHVVILEGLSIAVHDALPLLVGSSVWYPAWQVTVSVIIHPVVGTTAVVYDRLEYLLDVTRVCQQIIGNVFYAYMPVNLLFHVFILASLYDLLLWQRYLLSCHPQDTYLNFAKYLTFSDSLKSDSCYANPDGISVIHLQLFPPV